MSKIRAAMTAGHIALALAISAWVYASAQVNALNIRGATGDVDFWIRFGDIGYYAGIACWVFCVAASLVALFGKKLKSKVECLLWLALSFISAPIVAFLMYAMLKANF